MKEYLKKIISSLLILTMCVALVPSAKISAEDYENEIVIGDFNYLNDTEVCTDRFYYSDSYFEESSYNLNNPHLRTMSLVLSLATFTNENLEKQDTYVRDVMTKINLIDIEAEDMQGSSDDSIGTMIGHKNIGTNELVTVVVRGGNYGKEWASNVTVGTEGDSAGFADAASKTVSRIKEYLSDHNITSPKIWIVGYSRGGAVVNLASNYINEHLNDFGGMTGNDLYAFCFEAPAAVYVDDNTADYGNIHHVVNCNDIIPYLLPKQWYMYRTGTVEVIGNPDKTITGRMFAVDGPDGAGFVFAKEVNETEYFESFQKLLADTTTRRRYALYEKNISSILSFYATLSDEDIETLVGSFNAFKECIMDDYMLLFSILALLSEPGEDNELYDSVTAGLISAYESSFGESEKPEVCESFIELANTNLKPLLKLLGPIVGEDFFYVLDFEYCDNYDPNVPMDIEDIASLFNFEGLFVETEGKKTINQEALEEYLLVAERLGRIIGYHLAYDIAYNDEDYISPEEFRDYFNCIYEVDEDTGTSMYNAFKNAYSAGYDSGEMAGGSAREGEGSAPLFNLATLISNLSEILGPHYPKPEMEIIKSLDSYYQLSNDLVTEDMDYLDSSHFYNRTDNTEYTIRTDRGYAEIPAGKDVDMDIPVSPATLIFESDLEDIIDYPAGSLCYFYGGEVSEADLEILKNAMKENDGLGYFALELDIRIRNENGERSAQLTKGNILISVEVPEGFVQEGEMEYFVLHLKKDGKVELIPAELVGNYLRFRINSLSPFLFTYRKKVRRYQIPVTGVE